MGKLVLRRMSAPRRAAARALGWMVCRVMGCDVQMRLLPRGSLGGWRVGLEAAQWGIEREMEGRLVDAEAPAGPLDRIRWICQSAAHHREQLEARYVMLCEMLDLPPVALLSRGVQCEPETVDDDVVLELIEEALFVGDDVNELLEEARWRLGVSEGGVN